jgi:hypothetical protein
MCCGGVDHLPTTEDLYSIVSLMYMAKPFFYFFYLAASGIATLSPISKSLRIASLWLMPSRRATSRTPALMGGGIWQFMVPANLFFAGIIFTFTIYVSFYDPILFKLIVIIYNIREFIKVML